MRNDERPTLMFSSCLPVDTPDPQIDRRLHRPKERMALGQRSPTEEEEERHSSRSSNSVLCGRMPATQTKL